MISALAVALAPAVVKTPLAPPPVDRVFSCSIGHRRFTVRAVHDTLIYSVQSGPNEQLKIIGSKRRGNVHFRADRYFTVRYRLRFSNGPYSYIVYSIASEPTVDAQGTSGVVVLKGTKRISDLTCKPWADLNTAAFELWTLPTDGRAYLVM